MMKHSTFFILVLSTVSASLLFFGADSAYTAAASIEFATRVTAPPLPSSVRQHVTSEFVSEHALILPFDTSLLSVYQRLPLKVRLSLFGNGQEQVLWENDDVMELVGAVTPPVLAKGRLNRHDTPDILFCYTEDYGTGISSGNWEQLLFLFLDGQDQIGPLHLSASDWSTDDRPPFFMEGRHGRPASERKTLLLLLLATETTPCTFVLWSRTKVHEHPPTNTEYSVTYQIVTYHLQAHTLNLISEESGTATSTARTLRALVETTRAQGETPLLLDVDRRRPDYVLRDEDWFAWERCIDEIEP